MTVEPGTRLRSIFLTIYFLISLELFKMLIPTPNLLPLRELCLFLCLRRGPCPVHTPENPRKIIDMISTLGINIVLRICLASDTSLILKSVFRFSIILFHLIAKFENIFDYFVSILILSSFHNFCTGPPLI